MVGYLLSIKPFIQICVKSGLGTKARRQQVGVQSQRENKRSPWAGQPGLPAPGATLHVAPLSSHFSQVPSWHELPFPSSRPAASPGRLPERVLCAICPAIMVNSIAERAGGRTRSGNVRSPCRFAWRDSRHPMQSGLFCSKSVLNISPIQAHKIQPMPQPFVVGLLACSLYFPRLCDTERLQNW